MPITLDTRPTEEKPKSSILDGLTFNPGLIAIVVIVLLGAVYTYAQSTHYSQQAEQMTYK